MPVWYKIYAWASTILSVSYVDNDFEDSSFAYIVTAFLWLQLQIIFFWGYILKSLT